MTDFVSNNENFLQALRNGQPKLGVNLNLNNTVAAEFIASVT